MQRVMKIEEPENESLLQVAWVSSARYHLGKGCVDISFDPQLKPFLIQLKSHSRPSSFAMRFICRVCTPCASMSSSSSTAR